jgi:hypothetical protein
MTKKHIIFNIQVMETPENKTTGSLIVFAEASQDGRDDVETVDTNQHHRHQMTAR